MHFFQGCRVAAGFAEAADLANAINVPVDEYRSWERGEALPADHFTLLRLAKAINTTERFLLKGEK